MQTSNVARVIKGRLGQSFRHVEYMGATYVVVWDRWTGELAIVVERGQEHRTVSPAVVSALLEADGI